MNRTLVGHQMREGGREGGRVKEEEGRRGERQAMMMSSSERKMIQSKRKVAALHCCAVRLHTFGVVQKQSFHARV